MAATICRPDITTITGHPITELLSWTIFKKLNKMGCPFNNWTQIYVQFSNVSGFWASGFQMLIVHIALNKNKTRLQLSETFHGNLLDFKKIMHSEIPILWCDDTLKQSHYKSFFSNFQSFNPIYPPKKITSFFSVSTMYWFYSFHNFLAEIPINIFFVSSQWSNFQFQPKLCGCFQYLKLVLTNLVFVF
jgi:hypothetical protein